MVMGIVIAFLSDNKCTPMVQGGGVTIIAIK